MLPVKDKLENIWSIDSNQRKINANLQKGYFLLVRAFVNYQLQVINKDKNPGKTTWKHKQ